MAKGSTVQEIKGKFIEVLKEEFKDEITMLTNYYDKESFGVQLNSNGLSISSYIGYTKQKLLPIIVHLEYPGVFDASTGKLKERNMTSEEIKKIGKIIDYITDFWTEVTKKKKKKQAYFIMEKGFLFHNLNIENNRMLEELVDRLNYKKVDNPLEKSNFYSYTGISLDVQTYEEEKQRMFAVLVEPNTLLDNFFMGYDLYKNMYQEIIDKYPETHFAIPYSRYLPNGNTQYFDISNFEREIEFQGNNFKIIAANDGMVKVNKEEYSCDGFLQFLDNLNSENRLKFLFDAPKVQIYEFYKNIFKEESAYANEQEIVDKLGAIIGMDNIQIERMLGRWNKLLTDANNKCKKVDLGHYRLYEFITNDAGIWHILVVEKNEKERYIELYSDTHTYNFSDVAEQRLKELVWNDIEDSLRK